MVLILQVQGPPAGTRRRQLDGGTAPPSIRSHPPCRHADHCPSAQGSLPMPRRRRQQDTTHDDRPTAVAHKLGEALLREDSEGAPHAPASCAPDAADAVPQARGVPPADTDRRHADDADGGLETTSAARKVHESWRWDWGAGAT